MKKPNGELGLDEITLVLLCQSSGAGLRDLLHFACFGLLRGKKLDFAQFHFQTKRIQIQTLFHVCCWQGWKQALAHAAQSERGNACIKAVPAEGINRVCMADFDWCLGQAGLHTNAC